MSHRTVKLGDTIDFKFSTSVNDVMTDLAGSPAVSAYVGNDTTEITAGITLIQPFDSRTGMGNVRVVATSGNGFAAATDVQLVLTAGTLGGVSVVGRVIATFDIQHGSEQGIQSDVDDIQSRLPATLIGGKMDSDVEAILGNTVPPTHLDYMVNVIAGFSKPTVASGSTTNVIKLASTLRFNPTGMAVVWIDEDLVASSHAVGGFSFVTDYTPGTPSVTVAPALPGVPADNDALIFLPWQRPLSDNLAFAGGNIDAAITSRLASGSYIAPPTAADNADAVWDEALAGHAGAGSAGAALAAAAADASSAATDAATLEGRLTDGRATNLDNLDAAISSRLAAADYTAPPTAADNADAVWDEAIAGHLGVGSTGEALSNAGAAGTPPTPSEIADEVQTRTIAAVTTVGSVTGKVTPIDVDGIEFEAAVAALMAAGFGVATRAGETVTFKRRDGTTTILQVTVSAATAGVRTASVLT